MMVPSSRTALQNSLPDGTADLAAAREELQWNDPGLSGPDGLQPQEHRLRYVRLLLRTRLRQGQARICLHP